jgi:DNA-directed RNA polymerase specialized sigma24 family protein
VSDLRASDPAEAVGRVADEKRGVLLRVYRQWLRREDLEDCYGQATLELLQRARREDGFQGRAHIANALEQKLCSRIHDRRRALAGRSALECALAGALQLGAEGRGAVDVPDPRAGVEDRVFSRLELRRLLRLSRGLTRDQRLVLACQLQVDNSTRELSERLGWSQEKYRKVAQRGRARLRLLAQEAEQVKEPHTSHKTGGVGDRNVTSL